MIYSVLLKPKFYAFLNVYAPPSGAAFAFEPPVEALWKQEGLKSFISLREMLDAPIGRSQPAMTVYAFCLALPPGRLNSYVDMLRPALGSPYAC